MRDLAIALAFVAAIGWGGWAMAVIDFDRARRRWMAEIEALAEKWKASHEELAARYATREEPTPTLRMVPLPPDAALAIMRSLVADCTCDVCRQRRQGEKGRN